jgi:hypothetical protein
MNADNRFQSALVGVYLRLMFFRTFSVSGLRALVATVRSLSVAALLRASCFNGGHPTFRANEFADSGVIKVTA